VQGWRQALAETWYRAIAETGYVPYPPAEVRRRLLLLLDRALAAVTGGGVDAAQARQIGATLADLHYLQPEVLGRTLTVLCGLVHEESAVDPKPSYMDALTDLVAGVASGYYARAADMILEEQEAIGQALVSELGETELALRQAQSLLERRVTERTAELVAANVELRREIGERQRAEEALRESEEKYRELVENMTDVIYALDREGVVMYISPSAEAVLGYQPAEMVGRPFREFVSGVDVDKGLQGFRKVLEARIQGNEYRVVTKSGEVRCVRSSSRPILEEGQVVGVQGLIQDVTERRSAEEALQASEARWRSLVESAPEIIATVERDLRITFLNRVPEDATMTVDRAMGTEITRYVQEEYRPQVSKAVSAVMDAGSREYCEVPLVGSSGVRHWYALHFAPILREGETVSAIMIARDISRRREVDEMKDNLIRDVSHELRTPLAKVQMSLELLAELLEADVVDRARASRIGDLTRMNAHRLLETVEGILDLSQLEAGGLIHQRDSVNLVELVAEVGRDMQSLVQAKGLELASRLPEDLPLVEADRSQIFRVLLNLVDNAVKFSDQGTILITAARNGSEVQVAVQDEGHGINPQNLERVFERFFQEKTHYQGVGVGLTICKAIVEGHGGRIWMESQGHGHGAAVRFTLPVKDGVVGE
jgi:PAS domain S-box-containing protein